MARRLGLILPLAWAMLAAPAQAAPIFTVYGAGPEPLRPGLVAAEAGLHTMPIKLAAAGDGRIAFSTADGVWTLRGTRLVRVPTPPGGASELAFSPSGDLLVATCPDGAGQITASHPTARRCPSPGGRERARRRATGARRSRHASSARAASTSPPTARSCSPTRLRTGCGGSALTAASRRRRV